MMQNIYFDHDYNNYLKYNHIQEIICKYMQMHTYTQSYNFYRLLRFVFLCYETCFCIFLFICVGIIVSSYKKSFNHNCVCDKIFQIQPCSQPPKNKVLWLWKSIINSKAIVGPCSWYR